MEPREAISVAILAIYLILLPPILYVNYRQGFFRQMGFFYLIVFALVRIAGGIAEILSVKHPDSTDDAEWAGILTSVGLSPLFLASSGLLKRANDLLPQPHSGSTKFRTLAIQILHLPTLLALALAIVGGTRLGSSDWSKRNSAQHLLKAGGVLFLLVFIGLIILTLLTWPSVRDLPYGEHRVFLAVLAALPVYGVRTIYGLLCDFENNSTFSIMGSNPWVWLSMAVIEEMIVVVLFTTVGIIQPGISYYDRMQAAGPQGQKMPAAGPMPMGPPGSQYDQRWPRQNV